MLLCKQQYFGTYVCEKVSKTQFSRLIRIKEQNTFLSITVSNRERQNSNIIQNIWKHFNAVPTTCLFFSLLLHMPQLMPSNIRNLFPVSSRKLFTPYCWSCQWGKEYTFPAIKDLIASHIYQQREHYYCWEALVQKKKLTVFRVAALHKNRIWYDLHITLELRKEQILKNAIQLKFELLPWYMSQYQGCIARYPSPL